MIRRYFCDVMSALLIGLALAALPTNDELLSKRGTLFETAHHNLKFELFVPSNWQPPSATAKRYPVIVFLHGRGESGGFEINNAQSLPLQLLTNRSFAASFPFITVVPQCPRQRGHPRSHPRRRRKGAWVRAS